MKIQVHAIVAVAAASIVAAGLALYMRRLLRYAPRVEGGIDPDPDMRMDAPPPASGPPSQRFA